MQKINTAFFVKHFLGATLAEWQKKREEEEAARRAAMRNSGGGGEDNDAADKKRMKALAKANPAYARALAKEQSLRAEIAKVTAQELKGTNISVAQAQARQQAQWDANGQAIYAANQQFKETFGKEMDPATKEQAIKDATVNGVFNAGLYSVNLNTAQAKLEKAAEEQRRAEQAAMQEARRQAEEEATRKSVLARGGGRPLSVPALDGRTGWWDTVKGTIHDGINQIRNEVNHVITNVKDNAKDAGNSIATDVKNVWNGSMTLPQAWNNSVAVFQQASGNSLAAMNQGYANSQRIYRETVDQTIQKTAVWLDEKRNPFYDLGIYALEQINQKKLIEARADVFSDANPLGTILDLGKPDYFDASISFSGGSLLGISKSISLVGIPEVDRMNKDFESPDNNQIGIFYAPGLALMTEGVSLTGSYGTGYMLPGSDPDNPMPLDIDRYLNSFLAIGVGGYFPTTPPLGGSVECYDSMTDLQDIPEQVDDYFGSRATPNLWIAEEMWQEFVSGKDVQDVPKVIGRPQNIINEDAVIGCRVTTGLSTPGVDLHVNISDSQYISTFGRDWKLIHVPTPIMNAIIDLRTPNNWEW